MIPSRIIRSLLTGVALGGVILSAAPARAWRSEVCQTFLMSARPDKLRYGSVSEGGAVVYDHTYPGEEGIAQFFDAFEAAEARRETLDVQFKQLGPRLKLSSYRRFAYLNGFDFMILLGLSADQIFLLTTPLILSDLQHLAHPFVAMGVASGAAMLGAIDFPLRYARAATLEPLRFKWKTRKFREGRSNDLDYTFRARVSETFARGFAEYHEIGARDAFDEYRRTVTAGLWRAFLRPESQRTRWITVRVEGHRGVPGTGVRVRMLVSRQKHAAL